MDNVKERKQYCRYCVYLMVNNFPYCQIKEKQISESTAKSVNHCDKFLFADVEDEHQDAFGEANGYHPRRSSKHHKKMPDGQMSITDWLSEIEEKQNG